MKESNKEPSCYYERRRLALAKVGVYLIYYRCKLGGSCSHSVYAGSEEEAIEKFNRYFIEEHKIESIHKLTKINL